MSNTDAYFQSANPGKRGTEHMKMIIKRFSTRNILVQKNDFFLIPIIITITNHGHKIRVSQSVKLLLSNVRPRIRWPASRISFDGSRDKN
ncbi:hypothetical protein HanRHA438_Chr04g0155001 [Helianthus annuus]|nr:hypothetical protein HanRHA438_Chr04g0155001 [Helianthus annuus]